jgi:hypothetical protein
MYDGYDPEKVPMPDPLRFLIDGGIMPMKECPMPPMQPDHDSRYFGKGWKRNLPALQSFIPSSFVV